MRLIHNTSTNWTENTVLRAQAGDKTAYGELVEQFQGMVVATAMRWLKNHDQALDLAQDVLLHGMRKLNQLRDPQRFGGWLRKITVRMAINQLMRRPSTPETNNAILSSVESKESEPLDNLIQTEVCNNVRRELNKLPNTSRTTLVAFYLEGQSLKQMSRRFKAPMGTIKRRLHDARVKLKKQMIG